MEQPTNAMVKQELQQRKRTGPPAFRIKLNPKETYPSISMARKNPTPAGRPRQLLSARFAKMAKTDSDERAGSTAQNDGAPVTTINRLGWKIDATDLNNLADEANDDVPAIFNSEDIKKLALDGPLLSGVKCIDETNKHLFYNRCLLREHMESLDLSIFQKKARPGMLIDQKLKFVEWMDRDILSHKKNLSDRWATMPGVYEKNVFTPARQLPVSAPEPEEEMPESSSEDETAGPESDQSGGEKSSSFYENNMEAAGPLYVSFEGKEVKTEKQEPMADEADEQPEIEAPNLEEEPEQVQQTPLSSSLSSQPKEEDEMMYEQPVVEETTTQETSVSPQQVVVEQSTPEITDPRTEEAQQTQETPVPAVTMETTVEPEVGQSLNQVVKMEAAESQNDDFWDPEPVAGFFSFESEPLN